MVERSLSSRHGIACVAQHVSGRSLTLANDQRRANSQMTTFHLQFTFHSHFSACISLSILFLTNSSHFLQHLLTKSWGEHHGSLRLQTAYAALSGLETGHFVFYSCLGGNGYHLPTKKVTHSHTQIPAQRWKSLPKKLLRLIWQGKL